MRERGYYVIRVDGLFILVFEYGLYDYEWDGIGRCLRCVFECYGEVYCGYVVIVDVYFVIGEVFRVFGDERVGVRIFRREVGESFFGEFDEFIVINCIGVNNDYVWGGVVGFDVCL